MDADLHLEINQPVKVELRSLDVLHNFYVPQFRAKMDMLPGIITYYWFTPEKKGDYRSPLCRILWNGALCNARKSFGR